MAASRQLRLPALGSSLLSLGLSASTAAAQQGSALRLDYNAPKADASWSDHARATANLLFANWALWQFAWLRDRDWAPVTRDSLRANLREGFEFDQDVLQTNFFGHPYHGSIQFNAARGAGLTFWQSLLYNLAGSLSWELFGEREKPSANDLAITTLGGVMLGEMTHRLSSELLDESSSAWPRLRSELAAAAVDPLRGFTRWTTASAFRDAAPGRHYPVDLRVEAGLDSVHLARDHAKPGSDRPALLVAVDVEYGDLLPRGDGDALAPFEFFELYAGVNLLNSELSGVQAVASGLLYGASHRLSAARGRLTDTDVVGASMNYEYVGTNVITYGAVGIGPSNHVMLRLGHGRSLRAGLGADVVPILGVSSHQLAGEERDYNFAVGFSPWCSIVVHTGRTGKLILSLRQYLASVVDGQPGSELIAASRLRYEVELFRGLGIGFSPRLVYRRGYYRDGTRDAARQLSTQLYLSVQP